MMVVFISVKFSVVCYKMRKSLAEKPQKQKKYKSLKKQKNAYLIHTVKP